VIFKSIETRNQLENFLKGNSPKTSMELERIIVWYKWVLSYNPQKYLAILLMILGPLYFIYRYIFADHNWSDFLQGGALFLLGVLIWMFAWEQKQYA
jgi:hypothetical protein